MGRGARGAGGGRACRRFSVLTATRVPRHLPWCTVPKAPSPRIVESLISSFEICAQIQIQIRPAPAQPPARPPARPPAPARRGSQYPRGKTRLPVHLRSVRLRRVEHHVPGQRAVLQLQQLAALHDLPPVALEQADQLLVLAPHRRLQGREAEPVRRIHLGNSPAAAWGRRRAAGWLRVGGGGGGKRGAGRLSARGRGSACAFWLISQSATA